MAYCVHASKFLLPIFILQKYSQKNKKSSWLCSWYIKRFRFPPFNTARILTPNTIDKVFTNVSTLFKYNVQSLIYLVGRHCSVKYSYIISSLSLFFLRFFLIPYSLDYFSISFSPAFSSSPSSACATISLVFFFKNKLLGNLFSLLISNFSLDDTSRLDRSRKCMLL